MDDSVGVCTLPVVDKIGLGIVRGVCVCYIITRVLSYHPCDILSPVCYIITRVVSYHPCVILSSGVFSCHPCGILSPMCDNITRVMPYHPCVILSPVWYGVCDLITRVVR